MNYLQVNAPYLVVGLIASLVPIILTSFTAEQYPLSNFDFYKFVRFVPFHLALFSIIFFPLMKKFFPDMNFWALGLISGLILSLDFYYLHRVPYLAFGTYNPVQYYALHFIMWTLVFGFITPYIVNLCPVVAQLG